MISAAGPYGGGDDFVIIYLKKILSALKKGLITYCTRFTLITRVRASSSQLLSSIVEAPTKNPETTKTEMNVSSDNYYNTTFYVRTRMNTLRNPPLIIVKKIGKMT